MLTHIHFFFFRRPVPLTTIVKYTCLSSSEEMAKMVFTTASDASALLYESVIAPAKRAARPQVVCVAACTKAQGLIHW